MEEEKKEFRDENLMLQQKVGELKEELKIKAREEIEYKKSSQDSFLKSV